MTITGNWTEWSAIWSEIIRVISKSVRLGSTVARTSGRSGKKRIQVGYNTYEVTLTIVNMCNKMNISNKSPVNNRGNEIRLLWPLSIWIVSTPYSRGAQAANEKWAPKSLLAAGYIPLRLHWPHGEDGMPGTICLCHNEEQHFAVELSAFTSQVTALIFRPVVKTIYRKSSIKLTPPK